MHVSWLVLYNAIFCGYLIKLNDIEKYCDLSDQWNLQTVKLVVFLDACLMVGPV